MFSTFYSTCQNQIDSYLLSLDFTMLFISYSVTTFIHYITNDFINEIRTMLMCRKLFTAWFHPWRLDNLYTGMIADQNAYYWLWKNGNIFDYLVWNALHIHFMWESRLLAYASSRHSVKIVSDVFYLDSYYMSILMFFFKFSFFILFFLNILFFVKNNIRRVSWINTVIFSKFFSFFESEEEVGSLDDALMFVIIFSILFSWFFLITLFLISTQASSLTLIGIGFVILVAFVLLIPFTVLVNFGLAFTSYVRGAGTSTNILIEVLFDIIGTLIVFTRFIVQNIRFVLIFWAYFELFEWIYSSPYVYMFNNFFSYDNKVVDLAQQINFFSGFYYFFVILNGTFAYMYYLLHLLILLFIQLGAYFLISFWLFFFFYTSFILTKEEKLFFYKRYHLN